jgi:hypothetical protein
MTMGPEPMIKILEMSVRFGMYTSDQWLVAGGRLFG